jgi:hypothetical protein
MNVVKVKAQLYRDLQVWLRVGLAHDITISMICTQVLLLTGLTNITNKAETLGSTISSPPLSITGGNISLIGLDFVTEGEIIVHSNATAERLLKATVR